MVRRLSRIVRNCTLHFDVNPPNAALFAPIDAVGLTNVWPCSRVLVNYLDRTNTVQGRDVLELGAGCGIVGISCAALGAKSVLMTDRLLLTLQATYSPDGELNEEKATNPSVLLDLIKRNVEQNREALPHGTALGVAELAWGDVPQAQALALPIHGASPPLILGSDCTFSVPLSSSLFKTVRALLSRSAAPPALALECAVGGSSSSSSSSSFIAAHQVRLKTSLKSTLALAEEHGLLCRELETTSFPPSGPGAGAGSGAGAEREEGGTFVVWEFTL